MPSLRRYAEKDWPQFLQLDLETAMDALGESTEDERRKLRERWPHTIALDFQPEGGLTGPDADLARLAEAVDPVEICGLFVDFVAGAPPDEAQLAVLRQAVEAARRGEVAA